MKPPSTRTRVLGHPVIAVPVMLTGCVTLFAAFHGSNLYAGIVGVVMLGGASQASEDVRAYKAWVREWNAIASDAPPARKRMPRWLPLALIGLAWFGLLKLGGATMGLAMTGVAMLACVMALAALLWVGMRWGWRRRRRVSASPVVTIVARQVMPVPGLADAYRALPPYCHALLRRQA